MMPTRSPRRTVSDTFVSTRLSPYDLSMPRQLQHLAAARALGDEAQRRGAARGRRQLLDLDALDLLEAALGLGGLGGLGAEPLDEGALARDLVLGARDGRLLARARRRLLDHGLRIAAAVQRDGAVVDVQGVAGDVVQEALVVRDDHRAAGVVGQELLEPADGQDVEVVGRLVEQQDVDAADQHLRQQHAQLEAARQRAQRRVVDRGGNPQPLQHRGRSRLQRVAVVRGDLVLEVGHPAASQCASDGRRCRRCAAARRARSRPPRRRASRGRG